MAEKRTLSGSKGLEAAEAPRNPYKEPSVSTGVGTWILTLGLGLLLGPFGCSEPISPDWPTETYLGLYGVLLAGSDTAAVIAQRGVEGSTSYEAITDGQLGVVSGDGTTWLIRENPDLPGCVRLPPHSPGGSGGDRDCFSGLLPGPVSVQGTYQLRLLLASGDSAVGETTIPAQPVDTLPGIGR